MFDSSKFLSLGITNVSIVLHSLNRNFLFGIFLYFIKSISSYVNKTKRFLLTPLVFQINLFIFAETNNCIYMKVRELVDKLGLKVLSGENGLDREIDGCYVSDLLSDVMGNADAGNVWITLQTHKNVMAVASLKEMACVILVKNLTANEDTLSQSNEEEIPILQTSMETFEVTGRVYEIIKSENLKN